MGTARAEDPGLSKAKEAAEAVPTESVRLERKSVGARFFISTYIVELSFLSVCSLN